MICLISGTNRLNSQTLRVAKIYERMFKDLGVETQLLDLAELPPEIATPAAFDAKPAGFARFSDAVLKAEGLMVFTPEYNGSFPGIMKVFIDHLKFPESFENRPVAFVGLAAGMWGAKQSVEHLEGIFRYRNAFIFNERIFLPRIQTQLSGNDEFTDPMVKELAPKQVKNFSAFCRNLKPMRA